MIAYLHGTVLEKGKNSAIILVAGIGYLVQTPVQVLSRLHVGEEARLYTHQVIRDDSHDLVGFASMAELEFFWRLTGVSGVGPKMALHLMSLGPVEMIRKAVEKGDIGFLASAQGVGRKTAQRVVLELKGKLVTDDEHGGGDEVVSALENLGYPRHKARDAAKDLAGGTTEERIKAALRILAK